MSDHTVSFYKQGDELRIRIDSPGQAAQSAPVGDPIKFLAAAASQMDLEVDDSTTDRLAVFVPAAK